MQILLTTVILSILGGQPGIGENGPAEQNHATTPTQDVIETQAVMEVSGSELQEDWDWLDLLTAYLCLFVHCEGSTWQPSMLQGELQTAVTTRMQAQITSYGKDGVAPGLSGAEKADGIASAEDTRDFILTKPGMLDETLETDYLLMLDDVIADLSQ